MKTPFRLKARVVCRAIGSVLRLPRYLIIAVVSSLLMAGLIIWSLNLELLAYILFRAPLSIYDKLKFFAYGYQNLFGAYDSLLSIGIVVFTALFGVNTALLIYVFSRQGIKSIPTKSGAGAFLFAILGGGCLACGTSLLAPIIASAGALSTPLLHDLGAIFNWLGSFLLIYSIYRLSLLIVALRKTNS